MREIKFRAWHDDNGTLEFVERIDFLNKLVLFCGKSTWSDYEYEDIIIEQFTGLTDKNGKEIYEGDIILHCMEKGIVKWDIDRYMVEWERKDCAYRDDLGFWCNKRFCEVISNIHERNEQ